MQNEEIKLQFNANLPYQKNAIDSAVNLFQGQEVLSRVNIIYPGQRSFDSNFNLISGVGNQLKLRSPQIRENLLNIQKQNNIISRVDLTNRLDATIQMETGTGKTYVYLRTILKLNREYNFKKFIIIVPNLAIREGVYKTLKSTKDHFRDLYGNISYDYFIYDSKNLSKIFEFYNKDNIQIMIINISAFNRDFDDESQTNIIYKPNDDLNGKRPIDLIKATNPLVIIDEPQSTASGPQSIRAIDYLNPLCTLQYSATPKNNKNLIYKLDAIDAFHLNLVKKIEVMDVNPNNDDIDELRIKRIQIRETIKKHLDKEKELNKKGIKVLSLFFIDKVDKYRIFPERRNKDNYINGIYADIFEEEYLDLIADSNYHDLKSEYLDVNNVKQFHQGYFSEDGHGLYVNTSGQAKKDVSTYDLIMKSKEEILNLNHPLRFIFSHTTLKEGWDNPNVFQICTLNPTRTDRKKHQEIGRGLRLCVNQEGERIHDKNINILTIMANESYSSFAKALQDDLIDEGYELGVIKENSFVGLNYEDYEGNIYSLNFDHSKKIFEFFKEKNYINENGDLQNELKYSLEHNELIEIPIEFMDFYDVIYDVLLKYSQDFVKDANERREINLNEIVYNLEDFDEFWDKIKYKTFFSVEIDTEELIDLCCEEMQSLNNIKSLVEVTNSQLNIGSFGVVAENIERDSFVVEPNYDNLPNILDILQLKTDITRDTIAKILKKSETLNVFIENPDEYIKRAALIMNSVMKKLKINNITYNKTENYYEKSLFKQKKIYTYTSNVIPRDDNKSLYDFILYDSGVEVKFANKLEIDNRIKFYTKLPNWFKIDTPFGTYNADWAICAQSDTGENSYFVIETKKHLDPNKLRGEELYKIECAKKHFKELGVIYGIADSFETFEEKFLIPEQL